MDVTDPLGTGSVSLYVDRDASGEDGELIAEDLTVTGGAIDYVWDVAEVETGNAFIYAVVTAPDIPVAATYAPAPVLITEVRPTLVSGTFLFEDFHAVAIEFDQSVSASLSLGDLTLTNLTTTQPVPSAQLALTYDAYLNIATLSAPGASGGGLPGILPDGQYRLSASGASITNADGEILTEDLSVGFFFLNGDASRDGTVNLLDFNIMAANFGRIGTGFSGGDSTYDGVVNLADFNVVASRFGSVVATDRSSPLLGVASLDRFSRDDEWLDLIA